MKSPRMRASLMVRRYTSTTPPDAQARKLRMLDTPDLNLTYPPGSDVLNPRHFYQVHIAQWLKRKPRPVTIKQMISFGKDLSEQKVLLSAQYAADELLARFAHRIRLMQQTPYLLMGNPHLSNVYEYYVRSFEMMRIFGPIKTMEDNKRFCEESIRLLTMHTKVVVEIFSGMTELMRSGLHAENAALLNALVKSLLTSRLSRRVIVKQHMRITDSFLHHSRKHREDYIGEVFLSCTIGAAARFAEEKARETLALRYPEAASKIPRLQIEGDADMNFPYIQAHLDYIIGEVLRNSMEACLKNHTTDPIVLSVSHSKENMFVRISDHGGGITDPSKVSHLWSFAKPQDQYPPFLDNVQLSTHGFFNLLFPVEDVSDAVHRKSTKETLAKNPETHFGIGLALARLYTEYYGGALELHSLDGLGCDVLLRFSRLGTKHENLLV